MKTVTSLGIALALGMMTVTAHAQDTAGDAKPADTEQTDDTNVEKTVSKPADSGSEEGDTVVVANKTKDYVPANQG